MVDPIRRFGEELRAAGHQNCKRHSSIFGVLREQDAPSVVAMFVESDSLEDYNLRSISPS
jgi:hypothetical protein